MSFSLLSHLVMSLPEICSSSYEVCLFRAGFTLAFFGAFRVGELVPPSKGKPGGLLEDDVIVSNGSLRIRIRRSKTDIFGRGLWVPLRPEGGVTCPVQAVTDYLAVRVKGSYLYWAALRADCRPGGRSLGFRNIVATWRGIRGLRWARVLQEALEISQLSSPPVILVLHAGGNDLCIMRLSELLTLMRADLDRILNLFPEIILVWSEAVPRVTWQGARDAGAVERARRTLNARMARFVRSHEGVVVRHRQLEGDNRRMMRADGVHLNDIGLDIFMSGLQDGVEQALFLLGGSRSIV